jgi:hypothetical protein
MIALTDASRHDWLQGRGPELTLVGFQDDATHEILAAHFQFAVGLRDLGRETVSAAGEALC